MRKKDIRFEVKVGDVFDGYHDGKCSPSRMVRIVVDDLIGRDDFSDKAWKLWRKALRQDMRDVIDGCVFHFNGSLLTKQFWDWNCDRFIIGHIVGDKRTEKDQMIFAKRPEGFGWYCINWNYFLDISGKVRRKNLRCWRDCAKECGQKMVLNRDTGLYEYFDVKTGKRVET